METTIETERATIGGPVPGYHSWILAPVVRLESWGPCGWNLETIDPRDASADGWSTVPEYRLDSPGTGLRLAVRVEATGRRVHSWGGQYWLRGRVEFCGDGEPSAFAPCWILCR